MKTEFKREIEPKLHGTAPGKRDRGSWALRMLSENRINGLRRSREKRTDGEHYPVF